MVYIISRGLDVVVVHQGGEVENGILVSVLFPHGFVAGETSPMIKLVSFVDNQFGPGMSAWQGFDIFDKSICEENLSPVDGL